jgi:hypothetical protein
LLTSCNALAQLESLLVTPNFSYAFGNIGTPEPSSCLVSSAQLAYYTKRWQGTAHAFEFCNPLLASTVKSTVKQILKNNLKNESIGAQGFKLAEVREYLE